jgi:hypothetical protein
MAGEKSQDLRKRSEVGKNISVSKLTYPLAMLTWLE